MCVVCLCSRFPTSRLRKQILGNLLAEYVTMPIRLKWDILGSRFSVPACSQIYSRYIYNTHQCHYTNKTFGTPLSLQYNIYLTIFTLRRLHSTRHHNRIPGAASRLDSCEHPRCGLGSGMVLSEVQMPSIRVLYALGVLGALEGYA